MVLGSVLGSNPTKAFGFSVEGWCALKKGICPLAVCLEKSNLPFALPEKQV